MTNAKKIIPAQSIHISTIGTKAEDKPIASAIIKVMLVMQIAGATVYNNATVASFALDALVLYFKIK